MRTRSKQRVGDSPIRGVEAHTVITDDVPEPVSTRVETRGLVGHVVISQEELERASLEPSALEKGAGGDLEAWGKVIEEQGREARERTQVRQDFGDDLSPPDIEKPVVLFTDGLVLERADSSNWTLKQRKRVESGANAGRYRWVDLGYFGSPAHAARRVLALQVDAALEERGGGRAAKLVELRELLPLMERLETPLTEAAEKAIREDAIRKAAAVVQGEEDKARMLALVGEVPKKKARR